MRYAYASSAHPRKANQKRPVDRLFALQWLLILGASLIVARLVYLQVIQGRYYKLLATEQHELRKILIPERGKILVRDRADGTLHPLATNRDAWSLYAEPRNIESVGDVARELAPYTEETEAELADRLSIDPEDPYEPIAKGLQTREAEDILAKGLKGVGLAKGWARYYPETNIGGHVIGFVRTDDTGIGEGFYGIEGSFDHILAGREGYVTAQKDAGGRRLMLDGGKVRYASDGSDIVLTIDRTIQYEVCRQLKKAVDQYDADGGSVVLMNPTTGAIMAMCSVPDFDPANYGDAPDISAFNNPITFEPYEPGSVFKAITAAIGIEEDKIMPDSTYNDTGIEKVDDFEIHNSDELAHGIQTMRQVLEKSLNTGTIHIERLVGRVDFQKGVSDFGFGKQTGIELTPESAGNISSLDKKADVYGATASFGQGITVTPIQLASAFSAIANGGALMRPYIVDEIIHPDGTRDHTDPEAIGHPISARTSSLVKGMLASVVERGHATAAAVPGYYVAGKTGTAQVANPRGAGYLEGVVVTSFAGFAPVDNPAFVMVVKMDRPRSGTWAAVNAAPLFSSISTFVLSYLEIPLERDPYAPTEVESVPDLSPEVAAGTPDIVSIDTESGIKSENQVQQGQTEESVPSESEKTESSNDSTPEESPQGEGE